MTNPYDTKMTEIARLRNQRMVIDLQIRNEVAKAWRLAPVKNLAVFASTVNLTEDEVRTILETNGINARSGQ